MTKRTCLGQQMAALWDSESGAQDARAVKVSFPFPQLEVRCANEGGFIASSRSLSWLYHFQSKGAGQGSETQHHH